MCLPTYPLQQWNCSTINYCGRIFWCDYIPYFLSDLLICSFHSRPYVFWHWEAKVFPSRRTGLRANITQTNIPSIHLRTNHYVIICHPTLQIHTAIKLTFLTWISHKIQNWGEDRGCNFDTQCYRNWFLLKIILRGQKGWHWFYTYRSEWQLRLVQDKYKILFAILT